MRETKESTKKYPDADAVCNQEVGPVTLLDRLKVKRAQLARKSNQELREFDRQINLLESSNAEEIVREAERVLFVDF